MVMKCPNCNGIIRLEDEKCSYCGAVNEQAKKHIANMKKYKKDYDATKDEVYRVTKKNSNLTVKAVIVAALLLGITACIVLIFTIDDISYEIRNKKKENYIMENEKKLIENRDYYLVGNLTYRPVYSKYQFIYRMIMQRYYIINNDNTYMTTDDEYLIDYIIYFYEDIENNETDTYNRISDEEVENLDKQLKALLVTYCDFSLEEAESLKGLSKGEKIILLEEKFNNGN